MMTPPFYSTVNFPIFVGHHGNWDIYSNAEGRCVALPVSHETGNQPCIFGMIGHARKILGIGDDA